jgi:hypothetical protein
VRKLDAALAATGSSFLLVCAGGFDHQEKTKPAGRLVGVQALLNRVTLLGHNSNIICSP